MNGGLTFEESQKVTVELSDILAIFEQIKNRNDSRYGYDHALV
jgi:hypothetical protein